MFAPRTRMQDRDVLQFVGLLVHSSLHDVFVSRFRVPDIRRKSLRHHQSETDPRRSSRLLKMNMIVMMWSMSWSVI